METWWALFKIENCTLSLVSSRTPKYSEYMNIGYEKWWTYHNYMIYLFSDGGTTRPHIVLTHPENVILRRLGDMARPVKIGVIYGETLHKTEHDAEKKFVPKMWYLGVWYMCDGMVVWFESRCVLHWQNSHTWTWSRFSSSPPWNPPSKLYPVLYI